MHRTPAPAFALITGSLLACVSQANAEPPGFDGITPGEVAGTHDFVLVLAPSDIDGDGDVDFFSSHGVASATLRWYENDGAATPAFTQRTIDTLADEENVFAADMNGDGRVDLIAVNGAGSLRWYENDGATPPAFTPNVINASNLGSDSLFVEDIDGDGDPDVLTAGVGDPELEWYENDGADPPVFTRRRIKLGPLGGSFTGAVTAADVNGDNAMDVVAGVVVGSVPLVRVYESDGMTPPVFSSVDVPIGGSGRVSAIFPAELDNDGDIDLAFGSTSTDGVAGFWTLENTSTVGVLSFVLQQLPANPIDPVNAATWVSGADIDNDGDTDLIGANGSPGGVTIYDNQTSGSGLSFAIATGAGGQPECRYAGALDINADGNTDVIFTAGGVGAIRYFDRSNVPPIANLTQGTTDTSLAQALDAAQPGDTISAAPSVFADAPSFSTSPTRPIVLVTQGPVTQPAGRVIELDGDQRFTQSLFGDRFVEIGASSVLIASNAPAPNRFGGELRLSGTPTVSLDGFTTDAGALLSVEPLAFATLESAQITLAGALEVRSGGVLVAQGDLVMATDPGAVSDIGFNGLLIAENTVAVDHPTIVRTGGVLDASGAVNVSDQLTNFGGVIASDSGVHNAGTMDGWGTIEGALTNSVGGGVVVQADTQLIGDLVNDGTITVQSGTLTILGMLAGTGTITGDFAGRSTGGLFAQHDLTLADASTLAFPTGGVVRIGGAFVCSIDDPARFDLASAELRCVGLPSQAPQAVEAMSADLGPVPDGLERATAGAFPLGTLRVGPTATVVDLVDAHDNPGNAAQDAVYVRTLRVDAGATLRTNGIKVYYETLVLDGAVDDPGTLCPILTNQCQADFDNDGDVDLGDFGIFGSAFGSVAGDANYDSSADFDTDGDVDLGDFGIFGLQFGRTDCLSGG
ncbi:MAG: hypothetical protein Tsb0013_06110 [Phycisphaerales bacterium]